ncbi:MAG: sporulation initiation factor Spo0A [Ruminococcaceae bacterium]|nr:sporulation initiation factor Spo0A [Oscillospiraceae bacterium]
MGQPDMEWIFRQIAEDNHTTVEEVRREMQAAIDEAQLVADSTAKCLWDSIPRNGEKISPEDFIVFMADFLDGGENL